MYYVQKVNFNFSYNVRNNTVRRIWILLLLMLPMNQISAQDNVWSVWVYDASQGRAIQVDNTGVTLEDIILPVPAPYNDYSLSQTVAISPDGRRVAYAVSGITSDNAPISSFLVYDTSLDRLSFTYDTPRYAIANSLIFSRVAWNNTGNIVAFAYATGDTLETQTWRIVVLNAVDGRIISELDDSSPFFASQANTLAPYLLPILQFYGEATLGFNLIPYQTAQFTSDLFSYEWDIVTGRIIQTNRAPRITGDTLQQTGETITPIVDERTNYDATYMPYTNALHIYRPEIGARSPFFATQTYDIFSAKFVQNGQQVLVYTEDLLSLERTHLLVNRIGVLRGLPSINAINNTMIGTPDGFAYVIDNVTPFLIALDTRDLSFPQVPIWTAPENSRFVPVWATTFEQEDYEAWLQLAPPLFTTQVVVTNADAQPISPDAVPTIPSFTGASTIITVDSVAVTNTTGGDRLNMRNTPALSGSIIARVESGVRVVITDGPVTTDGFTWWEIRLPTGQSGWMVERADGVQTLLPAG